MLTRDDVIRLAQEAGFDDITRWLDAENAGEIKNSAASIWIGRMEAFTALVTQQEREAVIQQAIDEGFISDAYAYQFAAAILARGEKGGA